VPSAKKNLGEAVEDDCQKEGIVVSVEVSLMTPALDVVLGIADQGDL